MNNLDIRRQRDSRKRKLSTDLLRQIKKHLEFETIGVKEGTQIRVVEIKEVLSDLLTTWNRNI